MAKLRPASSDDVERRARRRERQRAGRRRSGGSPGGRRSSPGRSAPRTAAGRSCGGCRWPAPGARAPIGTATARDGPPRRRRPSSSTMNAFSSRATAAPPSASEWCSFTTKAACPPSSPSTTVRSHNGRSRGQLGGGDLGHDRRQLAVAARRAGTDRQCRWRARSKSGSSTQTGCPSRNGHGHHPPAQDGQPVEASRHQLDEALGGEGARYGPTGRAPRSSGCACARSASRSRGTARRVRSAPPRAPPVHRRPTGSCCPYICRAPGAALAASTHRPEAPRGIQPGRSLRSWWSTACPTDWRWWPVRAAPHLRRPRPAGQPAGPPPGRRRASAASDFVGLQLVNGLGVPRGDAGLLQAPGGAGQHQLPLRRRRAAPPLRGRRPGRPRPPPAVRADGGAGPRRHGRAPRRARGRRRQPPARARRGRADYEVELDGQPDASTRGRPARPTTSTASTPVARPASPRACCGATRTSSSRPWAAGTRSSWATSSSSPTSSPGGCSTPAWSRCPCRRSCTPARTGWRSRPSSAAAPWCCCPVAASTPRRPGELVADGAGQRGRGGGRRHGPPPARRARTGPRRLRHDVVDGPRVGRRHPVAVHQGARAPDCSPECWWPTPSARRRPASSGAPRRPMTPSAHLGCASTNVPMSSTTISARSSPALARWAAWPGAGESPLAIGATRPVLLPRSSRWMVGGGRCPATSPKSSPTALSRCWGGRHNASTVEGKRSTRRRWSLC